MSYIKNLELFEKNTAFYIYVHHTKEGVPFYVGKGKKNRCLNTKNRSQWWENVVNKYGYYIEIKEINLPEDKCFLREVYWINFYGRKDLKKGTLVNMTDGGEGVSNRLYSEEEKEKLSNYWVNNLKNLQSIGKRKDYFGKTLFNIDNPNYGNKGGKNPLSKQVVKLNLKGEFISSFSSLTEAEKEGKVKGVYQVCNGRRHQLKGYIYVYRENYESGDYSIKLGTTNKKTVLKKDLKTNKILKIYNSTQETEKDGFFPNHVARACRGERKTYKGFAWGYK